MSSLTHSTSKLPDRIRFLREKTLNPEGPWQDYIGQRLYPAVKALTSCPPETPWMLRNARMLAGIVEGAEPVIHPGELLAGYNYYSGDPGMWNEVNLHPYRGEDREKLCQYLQKGLLAPEQISYTLEALDGIPAYLPNMRYTTKMPKEVQEAFEEGAIWAYGTAMNHTVIGYEKVLRQGFEGIGDTIRSQLDKLSWEDPEAIEKRLLLESTGIVADAAAGMGRRYHAKALAELGKTADPAVRTDLEKLMSVLEQVPAKPARTFHEALQSLWFAHILNTWEDGINANSLGRLDQILYPYYKKDLEEGRITPEEAFELLCCLWLKLYRDYDVQQVCIGGVDAAGQDAANDLTYMMLEVTDALDFIRCLSVRLHRGTPPALLQRSLEIVGRGKGIPFFFNDDILVPALASNGIRLEDARDYAPIGCVEITIPGKANPHAVSNRVNLLKCLELALHDGVSPNSGKAVGPSTGSLCSLDSMEKVLAAYEKQVEYFTALACFESNRLELESSLMLPMPCKSMLTEGCIESGKDFNNGGALYNYHESMPMAIPNVADSLTVIRQLVFEEKKYTLAQLMDIMKQNYPDEAVRQSILRQYPKYGNDDDRVDGYAAHVMDHFCRYLKTVKGVHGLGFFAQPFSYLWLIEAGSKTGATPDGRRQGEPIAYSISPMQGRDSRGLTAVLNSLAKLPNTLAAGSTSAILEIEPDLFTAENLPYLAIVLKTAFDRGVGQLQFNVVSEETLRKAQQEPDKYRNLAVRVSGFSQLFCLLDKPIQDHIIARTKHRSLA